MGELARSAREVVATAAGTVTVSVATVLVAAGAPVGGLQLVLPAVAGGLIQELVRRTTGDQVTRAEKFVEIVEDESGRSFEEMTAEAIETPAVRQLLSEVAAAVVATDDDWTISKLAIAFVQGAKDTAKVDQLRLIVDVLRQLTPLHARPLRLLATQSPYYWEVMGYPSPGAGDKHVWRRQEIVAADPGLEDAFDVLMSKLEMVGMVTKVIDHRDNNFIYYELTSFGRRCVEDLRSRGSLT